MNRGRMAWAALLLVVAVGFALGSREGIAGEPVNVRVVGWVPETPHSIYADAVYAYVGCTGGFNIYDVSNPPSPVVVGWFNLYNWLQSTKQGNNPTSAVAGPRKLLAGAADIDLRDGLAYCADVSLGFQIVDVSNPKSPTLRGSYSAGYDFSLAVCVSGTYAYTAGSRWNGSRDVPTLLVIDVRNPSAPTLRGKYDTPGPNYQAYDVSVSGNLACVADGRLHVVDVTNPSSPVLRSSWGSGGLKPFGIYNVILSNGVAYATVSTGTVQAPRDRLVALDVRNPASPRLLASTSWAPGGAGPVFVSGHYVYASLHDGLYIYDVANPSSLAFRGYYPMWGNIFVRPDPFYGNLIYIGHSTYYAVILQFPLAPTAADRRWNLYR